MKEPTHYGVDISGNRLRIMKAGRTRHAASYKFVLDAPVQSLASVDRDKLSSIQAEVLSQDAGLSASMPTGSCFARWLQTPFNSETKAAKVRMSLLDIQLPFPVEDCVALFPRQSRNKDNQVRTLAIVARSIDVESAIQGWQELGIDPTCLQHEALVCWAQAAVEHPPTRDQIRVVFHLADDRASMVLGKDDEARAFHAIRSGTESLFQDDGSLCTPAIQQMAKRLEQLLRSQVPRRDTDLEWIWSGPGAAHDELRDALLKQTMGSTCASIVVNEPMLFLPRALAIQGLDVPPNLRVGTLSHPVETLQVASRRKRVTFSVAASGLLLCALNLGWTGQLTAWDHALQDHLQDEAKNLSGLSYVPPGQEVFTVRQVLSEKDSSTQPGLHVFGPSNTTVLRDVLHAAATFDMSLSGLSVQGQQFAVAGSAGKEVDIESLKKAIEDKGYRVTVTSGEPVDDKAFEMTGVRNHE